jgi:hypothetical protein
MLISTGRKEIIQTQLLVSWAGVKMPDKSLEREWEERYLSTLVIATGLPESLWLPEA